MCARARECQERRSSFLGREGREVQMYESQQILRATNVEIRRASADANSDDSEFVCECGRKDCAEVISLTIEEFDTFCATADGTPLLAKRHR
jgi:hypothetical protein